ncbi:MAG: hypothetical protein FWH36_02455 [Lentimicrobiaceae bacterium]|nr:hypothetical protein [Lentimicrobiaceae bacterium]
MKKVIIVFTAVFCINNLTFAQDIIVVQGNKEIRARVVSVSSDGIEYRLYDVESPLYKLKLQNVVSLTYENGRIEDLSVFLSQIDKKTDTPQELRYFRDDNTFYLGNGGRLSDIATERLLSSNASALEAWRKGNAFKEANTTMKVLTGVLLGVGGGTLLAPFIFFPLFLFNDEGATGFFIAGGILTSAGIVTAITMSVTRDKYKSCYSDAVNIYNKGLKTKNTASLHIGATGNGIGFNLNF